MPAIRRALEQAPEVDRAMQLASALLTTALPGQRETLAEQLSRRGSDDAEKLGVILHALVGVAPFFASHLNQNPNWVIELMDESLGAPRDLETLERGLASALVSEADCDTDLDATLRHFKYYELARLTVRDCCPAWVPLESSGVTLGEISALAEVILGAALTRARARIADQLGPPTWLTESGEVTDLAFCVLGLGKLGSEELNYSSDVDLVYVFESPRSPVRLDTSLAGNDFQNEIAPVDYFTRLAQAFGKSISPATAAGFLYRIDLDLRPEGAQGTLVVGHESLASYYEAWADTWERAAFMKARPVAGDYELGWRAIRQVDPMIYRASMDYTAVEGIRSLKQKIEAHHGGRANGFNVKIDSGGIRDIEFIAQALQLLHGARIDQIRERSTQRALERLCEVGLMERAQVDTLLEAYRFLRRTENRIQMEGEQQRHRVPSSTTGLSRLARSMGFVSESGVEEFQASLAEHREAVATVFRSTYALGGRERILELFTRNAPHLFKLPSTRAMIEELAEQLARHVDESAEPELTLNNLDRFVEKIGSRRFYYELLLDRPELVPRLVGLFGASRYLSGYLTRHPRLIEPVFEDPNVLVLSREELEHDLEVTLRSASELDQDPLEQQLYAMRVFHHRQILNVGLLDIDKKIERSEVETGLSNIAEVCIEAALHVAQLGVAARRVNLSEAARHTTYLVVGMGKLGSGELTYGSDLDVIFLYDLPPEHAAATAEALEYNVKLTQRLISALQTPTVEGSCYEIDARLRPSGNQGTLVTSLGALRRYHAGSAQIWERQALLRGRAIAGDASLAAEFERLRSEILQRPIEQHPAAEIDAVRQRMEVELADETQQRRNFKTGRGGILDVETVVQYLQLLHGAIHPELLEVTRLEVQLARLVGLGHIGPAEAQDLGAGWEFLQQLGSRLRIVENRSISDLDGDRGDLDGLAKRLGYEETGREGGARRGLLRDYQHHTEAIRSVYEKVMGRERDTDRLSGEPAG